MPPKPVTTVVVAKPASNQPVPHDGKHPAVMLAANPDGNPFVSPSVLPAVSKDGKHPAANPSTNPFALQSALPSTNNTTDRTMATVAAVSRAAPINTSTSSAEVEPPVTKRNH